MEKNMWDNFLRRFVDAVNDAHRKDAAENKEIEKYVKPYGVPYETIKNARKTKGLTQQELAELVNVKQETIYKYENGIVKNIPGEKLKAISLALGVNLSPNKEILDEIDAMIIQLINLRAKVEALGANE